MSRMIAHKSLVGAQRTDAASARSKKARRLRRPVRLSVVASREKSRCMSSARLATELEPGHGRQLDARDQRVDVVIGFDVFQRLRRIGEWMDDAIARLQEAGHDLEHGTARIDHDNAHEISLRNLPYQKLCTQQLEEDLKAL